MNAKQVIILDPGIKGPLGHHPPADLLIKQHFESASTPVRVLVNRMCDDDVAASLNAEKAIAASTYVKHPPEPAQLDKAFEEINGQVAQDLRSAIADCPDQTLVVIHTASFWHLLGVAAWAADHADKSLSFRFVFRFPADFTPFDDLQSDAFSSFATKACRKIFNVWHTLPFDVKFFADTDQAVEEYSALANAPVHHIAMPIGFPSGTCAPAKATENKPPRYLLLGALRKEKGLHVVEDMIRAYAEGGGQSAIVIQAPHFLPDAARQELKSYGEQVQVLDQPMPTSEFMDFLSAGDAVLMPYDPDQYRERSSQIFLEALGMGKPVIVTADTWMHTELKKLGSDCGLVAAHTGEAFAAAMRDLDGRLLDVAAKAQAAAPAVRAAHNADIFLKTLLG